MGPGYYTLSGNRRQTYAGRILGCRYSYQNPQRRKVKGTVVEIGPETNPNPRSIDTKGGDTEAVLTVGAQVQDPGEMRGCDRSKEECEV